MRHCVGEDAECNGPDFGHAEDCPYYLESIKEDSSLREELEGVSRPRKEKAMEGNQMKIMDAVNVRKFRKIANMIRRLVDNIRKEKSLSEKLAREAFDQIDDLAAEALIAAPPRVCDVNTLESLSDFVEKAILASDLLKDTPEIVKRIVMSSVRTALTVAYEPAKEEQNEDLRTMRE